MESQEKSKIAWDLAIIARDVALNNFLDFIEALKSVTEIEEMSGRELLDFISKNLTEAFNKEKEMEDARYEEWRNTPP